jgi:hypothetical protein
MNSDKIILDLCGGTGSWSKPYKDAGYDVRLITLPEYDVRTYLPPANVYGILATPPCTQFSIALADKPRDFFGAMEVVRACLNIIWTCRINTKLNFWALENPRGFLRQFLGKPPMTFEQWQFSDIGIKPTDLWGYYTTPKIKVFERPAGLVRKFPNGKTNSVSWTTAFYSEDHKHLGLAALRAMTPPGFAKAFFEANR